MHVIPPIPGYTVITELNHLNILGGLLKQFLIHFSISYIPQNIIRAFEEKKRKDQCVETTDILSIHKVTLTQFNYSYIFINALDGLQAEVCKALLETLHSIFTTVGTVGFFLTGWPHIAIEEGQKV